MTPDLSGPRMHTDTHGSNSEASPCLSVFIRRRTESVFIRGRQTDDDCGPAAFLALDGNGSAVQLDVAPRDAQSETCPGGSGREVRLERALERFTIHPDAGVLDAQSHPG